VKGSFEFFQALLRVIKLLASILATSSTCCYWNSTMDILDILFFNCLWRTSWWHHYL